MSAATVWEPEIANEADLLNFVVTLNQNVISRNGYFPMSGVVSDVTIGDDKIIRGTDGNQANLLLYRMDAKVRFVFKTGTTPDANGQVIKTFTPGQWKVVNIPRKTYLMSLRPTRENRNHRTGCRRDHR